MTNTEFSNEFDIMYNNITSNAAPGLDEYEKSVFLTKAEEEFVISLYNSSAGDSFERDEEARAYLENLIETYKTNEKQTGYLGLSKNSMFFKIPDDVWFATYESVVLNDAKLDCQSEALVLPVSQDDFYKINRNPFRKPSENRVLRLDNANYIIELISDYNISTYTLRYIKRPKPIVLVDLEEGLSINGVTELTECELNPVTHRTILDRAVLLAKAAWSGGTGANQ